MVYKCGAATEVQQEGLCAWFGGATAVVEGVLMQGCNGGATGVASQAAPHERRWNKPGLECTNVGLQRRCNGNAASGWCIQRPPTYFPTGTSRVLSVLM